MTIYHLAGSKRVITLDHRESAPAPSPRCIQCGIGPSVEFRLLNFSLLARLIVQTSAGLVEVAERWRPNWVGSLNLGSAFDLGGSL